MRVEKVLCDNELVHHIHLYGRKRSCKGVPSTLRGEIPHRPLPRREGLGGDKKQRAHTRKKKGEKKIEQVPHKRVHIALGILGAGKIRSQKLTLQL